MVRHVEQYGKFVTRISMLDEDVQMWLMNGNRLIGEANAAFFNPCDESHHPVAIIHSKLRHIHFRHEIVNIENDLCPKELRSQRRKNQKIRACMDLHDVVGSL